MKKTLKTLIICGPSGSGKSMLEKNLVADFPSTFHKMQQCSTRTMRSGERYGDPYVFIGRDTFEFMKDRLVGRIGLEKASQFKDLYGTIPDFKPDRVNTIILAAEGVRDYLGGGVIKELEQRLDLEMKTFILGLDVDYDSLPEAARREARDVHFIAREREVLHYANVVRKNVHGKYLNPTDVVALLTQHGLIGA